MDRTLRFEKRKKPILTEWERSEDERLRAEGFEFTKRHREEVPRTPISQTPTTKNIMVLFMSPALDSSTRTRTKSCREYLAVDCQAYVLQQTYIHVELCFIGSSNGGMNASFGSGADTNGVTFLYNKRYDPASYTEVWSISMTKERFDLAYHQAEKMVGMKYDYGKVYCYMVHCCIPQWYHEDKYTCASAVGKILADIGIGSDSTRAWLRTNKDIMCDDLQGLLWHASQGDEQMEVSCAIHGINKCVLPDEMKLKPREPPKPEPLRPPQ